MGAELERGDEHHVRLRFASPKDIRLWLRKDADFSDLPSFRELNLDRDWDALHYLLTGSEKPGRGPLAFLSTGGQEIQRGANDRLFRPSRVRQIHAALAALPMAVVRRRFKPRRMEEAGVYRGTWDHDPPYEGELFYLVNELSCFVAQGAGREIMVYKDDA